MTPRTGWLSSARAFILGQLVSVVAWIAIGVLVIVGVRNQAVMTAVGAMLLAGVLISGRASRGAGLPFLGWKALAQASREVGLQPRFVTALAASLTVVAISVTGVAFWR